MRYKDYKVEDIFCVKSSNKIFHANNTEILDKQVEGSYPYVVRATTNNGIRGYIKTDKRNSNKGNSLSFAQDTFTVFYQEEDFVTGNKVKVLEPSSKKFNKKTALYITTALNKTIENLTWGQGSNIETIKSFVIKLPVKKRLTPDFTALETLMLQAGGGCC